MNSSECELFSEELRIAFPGFEEIAIRCSPNPAATKKAWAAAWEDLSLQECRAELRKLLKVGGITYEDYRAPGPFIRRLVMAGRKNTPKSEEQLANERQERLNGRQKKRDYAGSPMALALAHAHELKNLGVPKETIFEEMDFIIQFGNIPKHSEKFRRAQ